MTWHIHTDLLDGYESEALSAAGMASVEMHVTNCESCRSQVAARADASAQARVMQALAERLDTPRAGWMERALRLGGLSDADARVVGATLALHGSWLVACVLTLAFVVLAATTGPERAGLAGFLVAAPLVPLAGVALAYGPRVDPTFEIATAAALPGARIVVLRTLAVTAPAIPAIAVLSLFLPVGPLAFAWLLPALGLAAASLALGTLMPLVQAATGLGVLWLLGTAVGLAGAPRTSAEAFVGGVAAFRPSGQLLFASLSAVSLLLVALRRAEFEIVR
ncbi:MAG: hypothetical protein M3450_01530 [Actinomycetota bacterium]|nr:hypothetical protein [Actinomycetota bacterium]MDQ3640164.1 hypothetical protein [Actinomycetota bacterium]